MRTKDDKPGFVFSIFNDPPSVADRQAVDVIHLTDSNIFLADYTNPEVKDPLFWATFEGEMIAEQSGDFEFGLSVYGTAKLYVEEELVVDNETTQREGDFFMGAGTMEETGIRKLTAGQKYSIKVEFVSSPATKLKRDVISFGGGGLRLGGSLVVDPEQELKKAVEVASSADQVILCVGRNVSHLIPGLDLNIPLTCPPSVRLGIRRARSRDDGSSSKSK
jgi:beta-glucosidase